MQLYHFLRKINQENKPLRTTLYSWELDKDCTELLDTETGYDEYTTGNVKAV